MSDDFTKMAPKMKVKTFLWKSCFNLVVFGQGRRNLGENGAWSTLTWKMRPVKCSLLFFRSFSLDFCGHLGKNSSHCQKFACSYRWRNDEGQGGSSRPVHNIFFGVWWNL